jgi:hypothetical protein
MGIKTEGVKQLVHEALKTISEPYGEGVIEDVFLIIENNKDLLLHYEQLCDELKKEVVNVWIAKYTKKKTGLNSGEITPAKRSVLIHSYTKLIYP